MVRVESSPTKRIRWHALDRVAASLRDPSMLGLAAAALVLRLWGIRYGLPQTLHPDEPFIVDRAVGMVTSGNLDPGWYRYPSFLMYLVAVLGWFLQDPDVPFGGLYPAGRCALANEPLADLYLAGRCLVALMGALTVLATALAAKHLWGQRAGLLAGIVLLASPLHVANSQWLTTDVPAGFFSSLCLLFTVHKFWGSAGFSAGLAAGMKYNAGLCLLLPVAFACVQSESRKRVLFVVAGASLLAFELVMPWAVLRFDKVLLALQYETAHYSMGHFGAEGTGNWAYYPQVLVETGFTPLPSLVIVIGWWSIYRTSRHMALSLALYPFLYYVFLASFPVRFERNLIPLLSVLALAAGPFIDWLRGMSPRARACLLIVLFAYPVVVTVRANIGRCQDDTRETALAWIDQHIGSEDLIIYESYCPPIAPAKHRTTVFPELKLHTLDDYVAAKVDYLVTSSGVYQRYLTHASPQSEGRIFYQALMHKWTLVKRFMPSPLSPAPEIRIYAPPAKVDAYELE